MDAATLTTLLAGAVSTGIVGSALTQITKTRIPDRWRTVWALGITMAVSLLGALVAFLLGGVYTVPALLVQVIAALGVAQGVYALIKPVVPGAQAVDVDALIKQVEALTKTVETLTTATAPTPVAPAAAPLPEATPTA
jgi:hypothetical protein